MREIKKIKNNFIFKNEAGKIKTVEEFMEKFNIRWCPRDSFKSKIPTEPIIKYWSDNTLSEEINPRDGKCDGKNYNSLIGEVYFKEKIYKVIFNGIYKNDWKIDKEEVKAFFGIEEFTEFEVKKEFFND